MTQSRILTLGNMYSPRAVRRRFITTVLCIVAGGALCSWLFVTVIDAASAMLARG